MQLRRINVSQADSGFGVNYSVVDDHPSGITVDYTDKISSVDGAGAEE
jgi:hypothetical protein